MIGTSKSFQDSIICKIITAP